MRNINLFVLLFAAIVLASCTSDKKEDKGGSVEISINDEKVNIESDGDEGSININIDDVKEGLSKIKINGEEVEVLDFRKLKELLPKKIAGMKRTDIEGQKAGFSGLKTSVANATYEGDDGERIEVTLMDSGGIGFAIGSMAAWSEIEIDKESKNGYERTLEMEGHKAFESYDRETKDGSFAVIVENRIIYSIDGHHVSERTMSKARKAVDIDDLERLVK